MMMSVFVYMSLQTSLTQDGDIVGHVPASPVKMNSALLAIMQDGLDIKW